MEFGTSSSGASKRVHRMEVEGVGKVEGEKREPVKPEKFRGEMFLLGYDTAIAVKSLASSVRPSSPHFYFAAAVCLYLEAIFHVAIS